MSDNIGSDWAKPGVEVVEVGNRFTTRKYGSVHRIGKVYKNGNFVLEGSSDQWRPWSGGSAQRTGEQGWNRSAVRLVTDEVRQEMARDLELAKARSVVTAWSDHIGRVARSNDEAAILSLAAKLGPAPEPSA